MPSQTTHSSGAKYSLTMGVAEEANFLGEMYYSRSKFFGVSSGQYKDIIIEVGDKDVFIVGRSFSVSTDRLEIDVFVGPTFTGGAVIPIQPYNGITPVAPAKSLGWFDPVVTSSGTLFDEFLILGSPDNNSSRVGGAFRQDEALRIIPANTTFLIRFRNEGTIDMDAIVKYLFFERKAGRPPI